MNEAWTFEQELKIDYLTRDNKKKWERLWKERKRKKVGER